MSVYYVDTHAHIYLPEFDQDRDVIIRKAFECGVQKILLPNIDSESIEKMNRLSLEYPDICYSMMGLHPTSVKENYKDELNRIQSELNKNRYCAVGEIGIDLYWDKSHLVRQQEAFRVQIELSLKYHLPLVIHARESFNEIFSILSEYKNRGISGVFHAFTGNIEIAEMVIDLGFYIGIGGILTYKKSELPSVVREVSLDHILLETDSPYLAPVPFRGKRNESSYIPAIAQFISQIKNIPLDEVAKITTRNAGELFRI